MGNVVSNVEITGMGQVGVEVVVVEAGGTTL